MTPERIAELRKLCDAATPGPWSIPDDPNFDGVIESGVPYVNGKRIADAVRWNDRQFIATARTALPEALDEIEWLRSLLRRCRETFAYSRDFRVQRITQDYDGSVVSVRIAPDPNLLAAIDATLGEEARTCR